MPISMSTSVSISISLSVSAPMSPKKDSDVMEAQLGPGRPPQAGGPGAHPSPACKTHTGNVFIYTPLADLVVLPVPSMGIQSPGKGSVSEDYEGRLETIMADKRLFGGRLGTIGALLRCPGFLG